MSKPIRRQKPEATRRPLRYEELNNLELKLELGGYHCEFLSWGFFPSKWWRNYMHVHSFYEVCYAHSGRGAFTIQGHTYPVRAGDLFVAKPGEQHEIVSAHAQPLGIYFWAYKLTPFPGVAGVGPPPEEASAEPLTQLLQAFTRSKRWVAGHVPGAHQTLRLICEEIGHAAPGYVLAIKGLASKLVVDTARAVADTAIAAEWLAPRKVRPERLIVERAVRYMRDNYTRAMSVHEVAAQVALSERHLHRLFKATIRRTPIAFLTQTRVDAAAQLLLENSLQIKEIAARVGYPDVRYFTTVFRRTTGTTPALFRKHAGTYWVDTARTGNLPRVRK